MAAAFLLLIAPAAPAQSTTKHAKKPTHKSAGGAQGAGKSTSTQGAEALERQLAQLSRALHDHANATTYAALAAFSTRNATSEIGAHAALALGYYDLTRDKPDLALGWLRKAVGEKLLREYVAYWQAQVSLALGQKGSAVEQLQSFRRDYPESVMTEQAVTSLAQTALAIGKNEEALAALDEYPNTNTKPGLLLLRAQAHEKVSAAKGEKPEAAAADYLDLYYRFPLNDEAKAAAQKIPALRSALGEAFPGTPVQTEMARAEAFYIAKRWRDASMEYAVLLPKLSGVDHQRADLRIVQCEVELGGKVQQLSDLSLSDPDVDAERINAILQASRSQKLEAPMLEAVEQLVAKYPKSLWAIDGLFGAGNYYWTLLDRSHAAEFYRRYLDAAPDGRLAPLANWRIAWTAYMDRKPEAADMIEAYVRRYPTSSIIPNALYWLGRSYERSGNPEHARSFYLAAANRFPLTYFGEKAANRLRPEPEGIGDSPAPVLEFLAMIPPAAPPPLFDQPLVAPAEERQARARALSDIGFDSSAELEYRAAYSATLAPKFLIEAAGAAIAAGHYGAAMQTVRQVFPQLEARRISEIPNDAWRAAFPLPFEVNLRSEAARNRLDPMLVAGLVRQESSFEAKALSRAGAVGLMQVMPQTARAVAQQIKVRFTRLRLTDPGYNLKLGSRYLANLIESFGAPEAALAAYNAGGERVAEWTTNQNYLETAEFVECIPFTETREYVQVVIRNAQVYRQVYRRVPRADEQDTHLSIESVRGTSASRQATGVRHPVATGENR